MGLLSAFLDLFSRRYHALDSIAAATAGRVELVGAIETLEEDEALLCPLTGEPAVIVRYLGRARGVSAPEGFFGDGQDIIIRAHQGRDFLIRDETGAAMIQVRAGDDLIALHGRMLETHGFALHAETDYLAPGERVVVRGVVTRRDAGAPHRRAPHLVTIRADSVERV
ncbi:MAG: hypothetical protein H6713_01755 [Myxococcales bacterium]|nr:hypothetical protein [Myxococcales bacterium]